MDANSYAPMEHRFLVSHFILNPPPHVKILFPPQAKFSSTGPPVPLPTTQSQLEDVINVAAVQIPRQLVSPSLQDGPITAQKPFLWDLTPFARKGQRDTEKPKPSKLLPSLAKGWQLFAKHFRSNSVPLHSEGLEAEAEEAPVVKAAKVETAPPAPTAAKPSGKAKKDPHCCLDSLEVYQDAAGVNWDVMLNQTNIGQNNNTFYVIQLLTDGTTHCLFSRWGRVGETGQQAPQSGTLDYCMKGFCDKFKDKTANNWMTVKDNKDSFAPAAGKYTLVETAVEDEAPVAVVQTATGLVAILPSKLDPSLQQMLNIIFDKDMFKSQMAAAKLDPNKMPLGKLTKAQVEKGYHALEDVDAAVKAGKGHSVLADLTSKFYTIIPHDFGRNVPPVLDNADKVKEKFDLLNLLNDIQIAVSMHTAAEKVTAVEENPIDKQYGELGCALSLVDMESQEGKMIVRFTEETKQRKLKVLNIFKVDRPQDKSRMDKFKDEGNRRLLWHGTNVAVVAAILKSGLRIMPHAGGRVGRGLYFASENGKSAGYVRCDDKRNGFMFLNEVCLGPAIKEIDADDWTITPEKVHDVWKATSVIARGRTEPDPSKDVVVQGEWGPITVAQGKPLPSSWTKSCFSQSEYLVYDEGRARIKYLLHMEF